MWGVSGLGGPVSQSCCPIAEVQAIPPAPATCPSSSLRVLGEGDGQMALEGQAASWVQYPPHPQPQSSMPGPTSTLWPPSSSPIQTPEPQRSSVLHDWANTVLHLNKSPVSPLQLPGLQEKLSWCPKEPSSLLALPQLCNWDFHYHKLPETCSWGRLFFG